MKETSYRPDIDGLRAIAVGAVVFHHLWPAWMPGGFIGVDVFFVISGFLITSQVYKEVTAGEFSLAQFYKRRINRIAPALIVMMVATLLGACVLLSPADLERVANSAISAIFGVSNIFFWREYGSYFGGTPGEAPLLHTWSLGIEEQFYLVWPILLLFLHRRAGRFVIGLTAAFMVGAIVVSQLAVSLFATAAYYLLPARFFELLIGSLLAMIVTRARPTSPGLRNALTLIGLASIAYALVALNPSSPFPGLNALWPCLGAACVIAAGGASSVGTRLLANRPMVFIGLISYSLYLWHWPLIAFLHYRNVELTPLLGVAIAVVATVLAWLSWKYVELPMRSSGKSMVFSQVFTRRFVIPALALLVVGVSTASTAGFPQRFPQEIRALEAMVSTQPEALRDGCHVPNALYAAAPDPRCRLGEEKPQLDGILIGDSFANHFTGMLDVMGKAANISLMDYTMSACPPILGYSAQRSSGAAERCRKRNQRAYELIATERYREVVLAASWPKDDGAGELLGQSIETLLKSGARITLILANQSIEHASSCPIRRLMFDERTPCVAPQREQPLYLSRLQARYPQVRFIDPNSVICRDQVCSPMLESVLLYRDNVHLNDVGSRFLGRSLIARGIEL